MLSFAACAVPAGWRHHPGLRLVMVPNHPPHTSLMTGGIWFCRRRAYGYIPACAHANQPGLVSMRWRAISLAGGLQSTLVTGREVSHRYGGGSQMLVWFAAERFLVPSVDTLVSGDRGRGIGLYRGSKKGLDWQHDGALRKRIFFVGMARQHRGGAHLLRCCRNQQGVFDPEKRWWATDPSIVDGDLAGRNGKTTHFAFPTYTWHGQGKRGARGGFPARWKALWVVEAWHLSRAVTARQSWEFRRIFRLTAG